MARNIKLQQLSRYLGEKILGEQKPPAIILNIVVVLLLIVIIGIANSNT